MARVILDPVTRLEGHLKIEVEIQNGQVIDAWASGTLFRGFETMLNNRDPWDAPNITQRICGVCPIAHGVTSVLALDAASGVAVPANARILRNLVNGADFVHSHILHFYHLTALDYINGPNMGPWQPNWSADKRVDAGATQALVNHYVQALDIRRKAHELGAIFGGRLPHSPAYLPGGFTSVPKAADLTKARNYLNEIISFIRDVYLPDVTLVGSVYSDYFNIGRGYGNLMAYGVFELNAGGSSRLLAQGRSVNGSSTIQAVNPSAITEQVTNSWYADSTNGLNPASGTTSPQYPKGTAYSWLKSPRYQGTPYEVGPLARMWVNGDYRSGISVMDRIVARAAETLKIAEAMSGWVDQLVPGNPVFTQHVPPVNASGVGLSEAARGALGHWVNISGGSISRYQVITPPAGTPHPGTPVESAGR